MGILESGNILVTGGTGTLGHAIAERREKDGWKGRMTVYSTDNHKQGRMRSRFPDLQFVQGDIRNPETLYNAMVGHDVVIHAAAVKVIPDSEYWSLDTIDVNVYGSQNVCETAIRAEVLHVIGISTDKACHPANAYGATKMLMEKTFQEYARMDRGTLFSLVRYGNVLESNGSVIEAWKKAANGGRPIKITDPDMTRFWLSPAQAVQHIIDAIEIPSGDIYVPMMPALSIGKLAEYTVGEVKTERIPLRPGEKMHETLVTIDERFHAFKIPTPQGGYFLISPSTAEAEPIHGMIITEPYTSANAREMTREELTKLLSDE